MIELKKFNIDDLEKKLSEEEYKIIYLNYDKKNNKAMDELITINDLTVEDKKSFYRIYAFNENKMLTFYCFDEDNYRYSEIKKEDFLQDSMKEREIYLKDKKNEKNKKFKVRIGKVKNQAGDIIQAFQYIGYVGGVI